jgi:hypothetical protein
VNGVVDKGKGKEVVRTPGSAGLGGGGDVEDEDGTGSKGEKKKKNNYKHLIKGVPGMFCFLSPLGSPFFLSWLIPRFHC